MTRENLPMASARLCSSTRPPRLIERCPGLGHGGDKMQASKVDLAAEIEELTRGAVVSEFLDRWTGKVKRVELGIKLAQNKWGQSVYRHDELV